MRRFAWLCRRIRVGARRRLRFVTPPRVQTDATPVVGQAYGAADHAGGAGRVRWLRTRWRPFSDCVRISCRPAGPGTINAVDEGIIVYANGIRLGGTDTLRDLPVVDIKEIQYISAADATQRFGTGHSHGAILITRK